ncbi:MAG: hypothetical protein AVO35_10985 [Candidatus Aegiribacteria sp. MLS_C]|nr:MAG: hypothetical protein AVO35_10985 [Candidatus Aegiribacteria sp. MLS_C]
MKLIRLRLRNYRGIADSEVKFGSNGITVVEGPNEAGKTSLGEAIRLLFKYPASGRSSAVKAIKPVLRDVGSEIELEMETGQYHFTYTKTYNRNTETVLKVTEPGVENHTGREAHDRAAEILQETIDVDLWEALNIEQGEAVEQADLSGQASLSAALDDAAGGGRADPTGDNVFEKVSNEYERYYTKTGRERKELQDSNNALEEAESKVESLKTRIRELEDDVDRAAELENKLENLNSRETELRDQVKEYKQSLSDIEQLENELASAKLKLESEQKSKLTAERDLQERRELCERIAAAQKELSELRGSSSASIESLQGAEDSLKKAKADAAEAENTFKEAREYRDLCQADCDYFNDRLHLVQMLERKARVDKAREAAAMAEELLEQNRVDEKALKDIQKAERRVLESKAKLDTGAPSVKLRGLNDLEYQIDGRSAHISLDEVETFPVSDRLSVTIPGSLQIEVEAGSSASQLLDDVEKAERKLSGLCEDAGVSSADEARQSYNARIEAQKTLDKEEEIKTDNLRDLSYDDLERRIITLEKGVPAYLENRSSDCELPDDLDSAKEKLRKAEITLDETSSAWEEARSNQEYSRKVRDELREQHQELRIKLDLKEEELKRDEEKLALQREKSSDDDLEKEYSKLSERADEQKKRVNAADEALQDLNPVKVRALLETAEGSLVTVSKELEDLKEEHIQVRTRLKFHGEEGLHEKLNNAQAHLDHVKRENEATIRRADAAELLYTVMKEERDKARLAYVAPLKAKIERLGRLVFNSTFEVEIDEDLTVASRVLDGRQVPFESLSGGTKEQISLISRLACAMTVSESGGAPLILDDALGNTDPERLKLMGAVLARAGKECQIIILTCVPERYSNVGEATVVHL